MKILDSATTTEAIAYLEEEKKTKPVMEYLMERIIYYTNKRAKGKMKIECILYDNQYGELAKSKGTEESFEFCTLYRPVPATDRGADCAV
jgi:cobalt-precorrin-5B (C1)-methyltransferase